MQQSFLRANTGITGGINVSISYFDPDVRVSYSGVLRELYPAEVRPRTPPPIVSAQLASPEQQIIDDESILIDELRDYLRATDMAVFVARNVTARDDADEQQPYNLQVPGGVPSIGSGGQVYNVSYLQFFQGDQVRGIGGIDSPRPGRRVLARVLNHRASVFHNRAHASGPFGSVVVFPDPSATTFVPARRALSWQLTDAQGEGVVRERYWLTFQPGEIRSCDGYHGVNDFSHTDLGQAQNLPQALAALLQHWQSVTANDLLFEDAFELTR